LIRLIISYDISYNVKMFNDSFYTDIGKFVLIVFATLISYYVRHDSALYSQRK